MATSAPRVQTVLGPIAPADLGPTLMHEHLLCDIRHPEQRKPDDLGPELALDNVWAINYGTVKGAARNYLLDARDVATDEVRRMVAAGGRAIVDLSSGGLSPDPLGLVEIARATGAHVILGCGHYVHDYQDPANATRTVEDLAEEIVESVEDGVWGTDVRAGIIGEIGCSAPWTALEQRVMLAAVLAQRQTGAAINVHPGRHPDQPQEAADFIRVKGGRMERVIISHIDRTVFDADRLGRLADAGCVLEWDLFGQEASYYRAGRHRHAERRDSPAGDPGPDRPRAPGPGPHLARHLLSLTPGPLGRPRLRAHLRQRGAADAPARLLGARDPGDPGGQPPAPAHDRLNGGTPWT